MKSVSALIKGFGIGDIDTCITRLAKMVEQVKSAKATGLNIFTGVEPNGGEFGWFTNAETVNAVLAEKAREKGDGTYEDVEIDDFMLKLQETLSGTGMEGKKWTTSVKTLEKTLKTLRTFRSVASEISPTVAELKTKGTTLVLALVGKQRKDKTKPIYGNPVIGISGPQNWTSQRDQKRAERRARKAAATAGAPTQTTEPQQVSAS